LPSLYLLLLPRLFHGFHEFVGGFSLFGHLDHISVNISDSFRITEGHTLGIAITVVALYGHTVLDIEEGMAKGACHHAGPAPDA
jgi:hypothetical protein